MKRVATAIIITLILVVFSLHFYFAKKSETTPEPSLTVEQIEQAVRTPTLFVIPSKVKQGEPVMISVAGLSTTTIKEIDFNGKAVSFFNYNLRPTVFIPISLNDRVGNYSIVAKLSNGQQLKSNLTVLVRPFIEQNLGIPAKLGGDTPTAQKSLVNNLAIENEMIKLLPTNPKILWSLPFIYPVKNPIVTDSYGYTRLTGAYTISHLGTDFKADEGTKVFAMNSGKVVFASSTVVYGNMVVIDHGLGLQSLYLHLSRINVVKGQMVSLGQTIGQSGQTGYAEMPHLHISVKINTVSIDPIKFLNLFQ